MNTYTLALDYSANQTQAIDQIYAINVAITNINDLIQYFNLSNAVLFLLLPIAFLLFNLILSFSTKDVRVSLASVIIFVFIHLYLNIFNYVYGPFLDYLGYPYMTIEYFYYVLFVIQLAYTIYLLYLNRDSIKKFISKFENK